MPLTYLLTFLTILAIITDMLISVQILKEKELKFNEINMTPRASVIVPVRGIDECMEENVKSLLQQDYPDYQVVYVVDPDSEPNLVEKLKKIGVKVIISNYRCELCSGKIRAQLSGLASSDGEVVVFADSDTRYDKLWLRKMVSALDKFDAATTYPWPKPTHLSIKNLVRAGFWTLGFESQFSGKNRFLWGGSMAFKRDLILRAEVMDELSREWCDDCTMTRIIKRKGGRIGFLMDAMPLNIYDEKDLIRWSSRQLITIRKYSPKGATAYLLAGFIFLIFLILSPVDPILITPYLFWIIKNIIRGRKYGKLSIIPSLMTLFAIQYALFLLLYNWNKREVVWRGKRYILRN